MPRTYIRKKIKTYTPQDLTEAVEKVINGELTQYSAAKKYNIPLTTIHDKINKRCTKSNAGRPTVIPLEEEKKLAETIIIMEKWGFGLSRYEIMELVGEYVRVNNINTPFKNNTPGPDWFINFKKRHRLSIKKAQPVEFVRRQMTDPFIIAEYFKLLENTLKNCNLFEKPHLIYNLDETSLCLDPSRTKVVGQLNKPCARTTQGSGKENITVLAGASASGKKLPPLIVFKGKFVWDQWMADTDCGNYDFEISYAASNKGWMETDIFYNYFQKIFIPNIGEERPVLIIYDGHSTHVDVRVVELAIRNDITILKLPPHTSHLLQPLDLTVFKSLKTIWDAKLVEWQRRNIGTKMPKKIFSQTLAETWKQTSPNVIISGFHKAGIHPFNAHVVPVDKYDPDAYKRFQKTLSATNLAQAQPNTKNPKSLLDICVDLFNNLPIPYEHREENEVILLSQISKTYGPAIRFIAKDATELPVCLRKTESTPQTQTQKIKIISNVLIKKAPEPQNQTITFEELVLRKINQDKKDISKIKKKRVTKGAEVITATMGKKILEEIEETKKTKPLKKTIDNRKTQEKPGPSGIKNRKKRKRQSSFDSITSVSDIMSEHSDSDIIDFEDLIHDYPDDDFKMYEKETRSPNRFKDLVCNNVTNENILDNKDSNSRIKNKGKGKKSKGKENQVINKSKLKQENRQVDKNYEDCRDDYKEGKNMSTKESKTDTKDTQLFLDLEIKEKQEMEKNLAVNEFYKVNDTVLVRYFVRQKWKYYIGFIEEIVEDEELYFSINFLKTMRSQQQFSFIMTKRKDSDKVPESLIVKKIEIQKRSNTDKEYFLCNNEDTVYFN